MTRVLMAIASHAMGGAEGHALDLAERLSARGHDIAVLLRPGLTALSAGAEAGRLERFEASTYPEVAAVIDRWRPEVVQHFDSTIVVAGLDVAEHRAASVQLLHANYALETRFRPVPTDEADVLVAVSASVARFAPPGGPPPRVIWTGIDTERFRPNRQPRLQGPVRLLCVGRLDEAAKRPSAVLAACARLPEGSCWLTFLGDGPDADALEAKLPSWARIVRGWTDPGAAYADADVLISASPSEGYGLALAEAAACGLAVVATRAYGITERMEAGTDALLVDAPEALGDALATLVQRPELRQRLGAAARAWAVSALDVEAMVTAYEAAHNDALTKRGGSS